jgi:DnaD/phage-associated family protein
MAIKTPAENLILLPRDVLSHIKNASAEELKVLLYFFAQPDSSVADAARELGLTVSQTESAVAFWRGASVFAESEGKKKKVASDTSVYRNYDSQTLTDALINQSDFAMLNEFACERLAKSVLTKNDLSALFYLYDFARIPAPVICGIVEDCCANGKSNMQYIFKTAISLYEQGIDTYEKLERHLARKAEINSNIGKLRRLCGMGDRALTSKEKKTFDQWFGEWAFNFDVVELAYEKTVDATGKVSISYMNTILRRWYDSGFATVEDINTGDSSRKAGTDSSLGGSDEFIEAALSRGFDDLFGDDK